MESLSKFHKRLCWNFPFLASCLNSLKNSEDIELKTEPFYTKNNFDILFGCIKNPQLIEDVTDIQIDPIFQIAGNLGASLAFRKTLAKRAIDLDQEIDFDTDLNISSPAFLYDEGFRSDAETLDLSAKKLTCLLGLKHFANNKVTKIKLDKNCLQNIDVSQILKYFPKLKELDVSHNKLKKIKIVKTPDYFKIDASYNKLEDLDKFSLGEANYLLLNKNLFNKTIQEKIWSNMKERSYWQHLRTIYRFIPQCLILKMLFFYTFHLE